MGFAARCSLRLPAAQSWKEGALFLCVAMLKVRGVTIVGPAFMCLVLNAISLLLWFCCCCFRLDLWSWMRIPCTALLHALHRP